MDLHYKTASRALIRIVGYQLVPGLHMSGKDFAPRPDNGVVDRICTLKWLQPILRV